MNSKKLNNLGTALVTGAAKRIGREIAIFLASQGYDLVINYNNSKKDAQDLAVEISKKFKVKCAIFKADLSDLEQTKKLAEFVRKNSQNWSLLVNNASIFNRSKFLKAAENEMSDNFNIHFFSPLILAKEFAKSSQTGHIINLVDKNITRYDTNYFYYLMSKKFLAELTKMLALELAPKFRVNAIAPGLVLESVGSPNPQDFAEKIPLRKKGDTKNIVQAVEFLLINEFVNGHILFVDGGGSLNHAG